MCPYLYKGIGSLTVESTTLGTKVVVSSLTLLGHRMSLDFRVVVKPLYYDYSVNGLKGEVAVLK